MEPLLGLVFAALVAAPAMLWRWHRNQALADAWRTAASTEGLALEHVRAEAGVFSTELVGHSDDFVVTVGRKGGNNRPTRTVMSVSSPSRLGWHTGLQRETLGTALNQLMGEKDIRIGDRAFDDDVAVYGQREVLVAVLDTPTRTAVRQALAAGTTVENGRILRELPGLVTDPQVLVGTGRELLALARALATPRNVAGKLAANAGRDPEPAVRKRNLEVLLESFAESPETGEAMRQALDDADPAIRLMAARFLGDDGRPALLALAGDPSVPQELAVAALESLREGAELASLAAILDAAAATGRGKVACAAAAALGRLRNPEAGAVLAPHLASPDRVLAAAAARALGESGDTSHTAALVAALAPGKGDLQVAAAEALARVGPVEAVAALHAAVAADPLDLGLRRAAAAAIAAIQARLVGAAPGQLAVADDEAGSLAIAPSDGGAVELSPPEEPEHARPASGTPGTRSSLRE